MWRLLCALLTWATLDKDQRAALKRERELLESLEPVKDMRRFL